MAETVLELKNIVKDYGAGTILNNISLDVHKSEVVVIIGPSGCGKSTLLRCINGLEPIQSGEIIYHGKVIDMVLRKSDKKLEWFFRIMIYFLIKQFWRTSF